MELADCRNQWTFDGEWQVWCLEDQNEADGENVSWGEAYKRLLNFLPVEKTFDTVCLDQIHEAMEQKMMKKA